MVLALGCGLFRFYACFMAVVYCVLLILFPVVCDNGFIICVAALGVLCL